MVLWQVDAGVRGVSPGPFTEDFLVEQQALMRFLGGLAVAGLSVAANLFDAACTRHLGASLDAICLIMITGFITTALRQVCCCHHDLPMAVRWSIALWLERCMFGECLILHAGTVADAAASVGKGARQGKRADGCCSMSASSQLG